MSRAVYEERTRIGFSLSIASIAAPTVAELTTSTTDLSTYVTKDGLKEPTNQNMVDAASIAERFDAQRAGSFGGPISLTCFRDNVDADDDAYNLFTWGLTGFLHVRWGPLYTAAYAAGQKIRVYAVESHEPVPQDSAANEMARFNVMLAVTATPNLKATVAA